MRYWARKDTTGKTATVESYSHDLDVEGATEIDKLEYDAFIASLPVIKPEPVRDAFAEIDKINEKLDLLLKIEK